MQIIRCLMGKSRRVEEAERMMQSHRIVAARELEDARRKADAAHELMARLKKDMNECQP